MTPTKTPAELAEDIRRLAEAYQDAWIEYRDALCIDVAGCIVATVNAHNRAEAALHAAIDQLQAMARDATDVLVADGWTWNGWEWLRPEAMTEGVQSEGFSLVPSFRGYAHLGIGQYLINHSAAGHPAEVVITVATEDEKAGRMVGDDGPNVPGELIQPEAMAVRIRFENAAGLAALQKQLDYMRDTHFPVAPEARKPLGWQPIETAPKDGTVVALAREGRVTAGHWRLERWPTAAEHHSTTGEYLGQFETGECIEACWYSEGGGFAEDQPPTHWMPMPAAPAAHGITTTTEG